MTIEVFAVSRRVGARDDMWTGRSTLMVELQEAAVMMSDATSRSLVLIDELGRGTSTWDGTALAKAVLQHFVQKINSITVFVTHYKSLTETGALMKKQDENAPYHKMGLVKNGHMGYFRSDANGGSEEESDETRVSFLYKLTDGPCPSSFGINVARLAGLPHQVTDLAAKLAKEYERSIEKASQ